MPSVQIKDFAGKDQTIPFDVKPDHCPLCHHGIDAAIFGVGTMIGTDPGEPGTIVETLFRCTRRDCFRLFIGRYRRTRQQYGIMQGDFQLFAVTPWNVIEPTISDEIREISPLFVTVYAQSSKAEALELGEIAGVGYRKALEFLIKDYCVSESAESKDAIEKEFLGATIANRVTDSNVKECARRAAWLGNDETHYVRKWEEKDIRDLKILIDLTMNWIRNSVLTKKYLADMPEGR